MPKDISKKNKVAEAEQNSERRNFLKSGLAAAGLALTGAGMGESCKKKNESAAKVKVLTADGKLMEVDSSMMSEISHHAHAAEDALKKARKGIPGKKFVMVIDLARCKRLLKCQKACQKYHYLPEQDKWLKVYKMQDSPELAPYWMPKPCMHNDHPPCVKVCPVNAMFKRDDGIVLVDNERCIGCRFCMAACPYSSISFNWAEPVLPSEAARLTYSPETSVPRKKGTVEKCDFCPDMLKEDKLPHCITACPNGVFYFGDLNEDSVTNGDETVRFSELMRDKAGYRYLEGLGARPGVYYLPPANRLFPFNEEGL